MSAVHGRILGTKICEALGLNPNEVVELTLHCGLQSVATVTVELLPQLSAEGELVAVLRAYQVVERET